MKKNRIFFLLFLLGISFSFPSFSQKITDLKPTVLLVSFDGFRWDYFDKVPTPNLHKLIQTGTKMTDLIPIFPSITFPNHYAIVTGLYSEHNGIVGNDMWDPKTGHSFAINDADAVDASEWWEGEPLWVTAEKQGQISATMFWVGSTAMIEGVRPHYWKRYDRKVTGAARVQQILDWLDLPAEKRPTFLTLYFEDADSMGHEYGPDSEQVKNAVMNLDNLTGELLEGLQKREISEKINLIFVSDHGMTNILPDQTIALSRFFDTNEARLVGGGASVQIFPKASDPNAIYNALKNAHPHLHVFKKEEIPKRFHFQQNSRIAPILCLADPGWYLTRNVNKQKTQVGTHGYDPQAKDMHGIFIAHGPDFRPGYVQKAVENIHLYSLIAHLLHLRPKTNDGDFKKVQGMLLSGH